MTWVYVVQMWLSCDSNDPAAVAAFETRFPPALEAKWSTMVFPDQQQNQLKAELDGEIFDECGASISADVGAPVVGVDAFVSDDWNYGGGGLHEGHAAIYGLVNGAPKRRWKFRVGQLWVSMIANCEWQRVQIQ